MKNFINSAFYFAVSLIHVWLYSTAEKENIEGQSLMSYWNFRIIQTAIANFRRITMRFAIIYAVNKFGLIERI